MINYLKFLAIFVCSVTIMGMEKEEPFGEAGYIAFKSHYKSAEGISPWVAYLNYHFQKVRKSPLNTYASDLLSAIQYGSGFGSNFTFRPATPAEKKLLLGITHTLVGTATSKKVAIEPKKPVQPLIDNSAVITKVQDRINKINPDELRNAIAQADQAGSYLRVGKDKNNPFKFYNASTGKIEKYKPEEIVQKSNPLQANKTKLIEISKEAQEWRRQQLIEKLKTDEEARAIYEYLLNCEMFVEEGADLQKAVKEYLEQELITKRSPQIHGLEGKDYTQLNPAFFQWASISLFLNDPTSSVYFDGMNIFSPDEKILLKEKDQDHRNRIANNKATIEKYIKNALEAFKHGYTLYTSLFRIGTEDSDNVALVAFDGKDISLISPGLFSFKDIKYCNTVEELQKIGERLKTQLNADTIINMVEAGIDLDNSLTREGSALELALATFFTQSINGYKKLVNGLQNKHIQSYEDFKKLLPFPDQDALTANFEPQYLLNLETNIQQDIIQDITNKREEIKLLEINN